MKKIFIVFFVLLYSVQLLGQNLVILFGKDGKEKLIKGKDLCSMGNHSPFESFESYNLILRNSGSEKLHLSNIKFKKSNSNIQAYLPPSIDILAGESVSIVVIYAVSKTFQTETNSITFETNDIQNPNIEIPIIVNPDKGNLSIKSNFPLKDQTITLGDVKLKNTKSINITLDNVGDGFMRVGAIKNIVTNNKVSFSFNKDEIFGPFTTTNSNVSFSGIKKGEINTTFSQDLYRGTKSKLTFTIKGKVIAPIMQIEYDSKIISENQTISFPNIMMKEFNTNFIIRNTGDDILSFTDVRLADQINSGIFFLGEHNSLRIEPGKTATLRLNFVPYKAGVVKDRIQFTSDGYKSEKLEIDVILNVIDPSTSTTLTDMNCVKLYPNPCSKVFNIEGLNGNNLVKIFDANGAEHFTKRIKCSLGNMMKINVPNNIKTSFFIVEVTNNSEVRRFKVIKK